MKKVLVILLICVATVSAASAQKLRTGSGLINVGLGLLPGIGANVSYDHALIDTWGPGIFTVGGIVSFNSEKEDIGWSNYNSSYRFNRFFIAPRATYRYTFKNNFEVYGSLMTGLLLHRYSYKDKDNNKYGYKSNDATIGFGSTVGCRYPFTNNLSAFAELGWNVSYLSLGLSIAL